MATSLLLSLILAESPASAQQYFYVSSSTVEALDKDLSGVSPKIDPARVPGASPEAYLSSTSCLGSYGPIGAYGPLGMLGPIGSNAWNTSYWVSAAGEWSEWSETIDGPLSEGGPLGPDGPVSEDQYYDAPLYEVNDFAEQLQGGGVWTVLGPVGPLGALGPLGPLGPLGAHGFAVDELGNYTSDGAVQRTVTVPFEGSRRTYGLFERYDETFAKQMTDNDTSFMVQGNAHVGEVDLFPFTSDSKQLVTVLVVPEAQLDDFDLVISDDKGEVVAQANSASLVDWVQLRVPAGEQLTAHVELYSSFHWLSKRYRLYVVGSTAALSDTDITGPHQQSYTP
jgi:hypothetical protein